MSALPCRHMGRERGASPLSERTRRKLLASLLRRAQGGDVLAAAELVRIGLDRDRARRGAEPASAEAAAPG